MYEILVMAVAAALGIVLIVVFLRSEVRWWGILLFVAINAAPFFPMILEGLFSPRGFRAAEIALILTVAVPLALFLLLALTGGNALRGVGLVLVILGWLMFYAANPDARFMLIDLYASILQGDYMNAFGYLLVCLIFLTPLAAAIAMLVRGLKGSRRAGDAKGPTTLISHDSDKAD